MARAHARVRHARHAAVHELTGRLVYEFDLIFIEDLNVRALSRGLHARAMQEVAFGEIRPSQLRLSGTGAFAIAAQSSSRSILSSAGGILARQRLRYLSLV